jgi:hypothetical protein
LKMANAFFSQESSHNLRQFGDCFQFRPVRPNRFFKDWSF